MGFVVFDSPNPGTLFGISHVKQSKMIHFPNHSTNKQCLWPNLSPNSFEARDPSVFISSSLTGIGSFTQFCMCHICMHGREASKRTPQQSVGGHTVNVGDMTDDVRIVRQSTMMIDLHEDLISRVEMITSVSAVMLGEVASKGVPFMEQGT